MRRCSVFILLIILSFSFKVFANDIHDRASIEFDLTDGPPNVNVEIKGVAYKFLVDPSLEKRILINSSIADRLNLDNLSFIPIKADVDGELFEVKTNKVSMRINGGENTKRKVFWLDRDYWTTFDGVISGSSLDYDKVSFSIPKRDDKKYEMKSYSTVSKKDWRIPVNFHNKLPAKVNISFKPHLNLSRANLVLTQMLKHQKLIEIDKKPLINVKREFGVKAQIATATLTSPVDLFTEQMQSTHIQINTSSLDVGSKDYNAIIVKGVRKSKSNKFLPEFLIANDLMGKCVKFEFVKQTKTANVYCEDKSKI